MSHSQHQKLRLGRPWPFFVRKLLILGKAPLSLNEQQATSKILTVANKKVMDSILGPVGGHHVEFTSNQLSGSLLKLIPSSDPNPKSGCSFP